MISIFSHQLIILHSFIHKRAYHYRTPVHSHKNSSTYYAHSIIHSQDKLAYYGHIRIDIIHRPFFGHPYTNKCINTKYMCVNMVQHSLLMTDLGTVVFLVDDPRRVILLSAYLKRDTPSWLDYTEREGSKLTRSWENKRTNIVANWGLQCLFLVSR